MLIVIYFSGYPYIGFFPNFELVIVSKLVSLFIIEVIDDNFKLDHASQKLQAILIVDWSSAEADHREV